MFDFGNKVANSGASSDGILSNGEDNVRFRELENAVTTTGLVLDIVSNGSTDETMLAQAMARYASGGIFAADTGSVNNYVLGPTANFKFSKGASGVSALFDGLRVLFRVAITNSGPCTINYNGAGSVALVDDEGNALTGSELTFLVDAVYDQTAGNFKLSPWANLKKLGGSSNANNGGGSSPLGSTLMNVQAFTTSGTYTIPSDVNKIIAFVAGSGGEGANDDENEGGGNGGDTVLSFGGTTVTGNGGYGGTIGLYSLDKPTFSHGSASGGFLNLKGQGAAGAPGVVPEPSENNVAHGTAGGNGGLAIYFGAVTPGTILTNTIGAGGAIGPISGRFGEDGYIILVELN